MIRDRGRRAVALALTLLAAGVQGALAVDAPVGALVPGGDRPDVVLLYTGDVVGYLEDCGCKRNPAGGLARRAWVVDQIGERFPGVSRVLFDSGNFSDNPSPQGDTKTAALLQAMERLGYEVVNVGERDIRMGYDDFLRRTAGSKLRFISANLVDRETQKPVFPPHAVVEAAGPSPDRKIRIGVIGVLRYNPLFLKSGPAGSNLVIAPPAERVQQEVAALEKQDVDLVVLLAALHQHDAVEIARTASGIDLVFGAYGGLFSKEKEGEVPIFYVGNRGQRINETRIFFQRGGEGEGGPSGFTEQTNMHFLTHEYPEAQAMRTFLQTVYDATADGSALPATAADSQDDAAQTPGG
jgi:2',3'-cyclic-nucleotide 2'-phosphodiesterase (5'-nucleotidase family)